MAIPGGLPPELQLEAEQLARRQRIADILMKQGNTPISMPQSGGRIASRVNSLQPMAQVMSAYMGDKEAKGVATSTADLGNRYENFLQQGVQDYMRQRNGTGVQPDPQEFSQAADGQSPAPAPAGANADKRGLASAALMSRNPMVQRLGQMDYEHENKLDLPHNTPPGSTTTDGRGKPLLTAPPLHQIPADWERHLPVGATRLPGDPAGIFRMAGADGQKDPYSIEFEGGVPKGYKRMDNGPNPNQGSTLRQHYTIIHTADGSVAVNDQNPKDIIKLASDGKPVIQVNADPALAGRRAAEAAAGRAAGTLTETQRLALPKTIQEAEIGLKHIDEMVGSEDGTIKRHPGFSSAVGFTWTPGMRHIEGSKEADFMAKLGQVKGGAFLQAYNVLKGGGAITEIEGTKGTAAITRMDKATSEKEFVDAARELQLIVRQGVARAKVLASQSPRSAAPVAPPAGFEPL